MAAWRKQQIANLYFIICEGNLRKLNLHLFLQALVYCNYSSSSNDWTRTQNSLSDNLLWLFHLAQPHFALGIFQSFSYLFHQNIFCALDVFSKFPYFDSNFIMSGFQPMIDACFILFWSFVSRPVFGFVSWSLMCKVNNFSVRFKSFLIWPATPNHSSNATCWPWSGCSTWM